MGGRVYVFIVQGLGTPSKDNIYIYIYTHIYRVWDTLGAQIILPTVGVQVVLQGWQSHLIRSHPKR